MWVLVMRILGIDFSLNIREDVDVEENFRRCSARAGFFLFFTFVALRQPFSLVKVLRVALG